MSDPLTEPVTTEPIAEVRPIEHWQTLHEVKAHRHLGAARLHGWGVGRELSERAYLAGVEAFAAHTPKGA